VNGGHGERRALLCFGSRIQKECNLMPIGILQLSDIHFRVGENPVRARVDEIRMAVQAIAHDVTDVLLVITGDVAYSGKQQEYEIATDFVEKVERGLRALASVNFMGTVMVPGNHDCDFDPQSSVRSLLTGSIGTVVQGTEPPPEDIAAQFLCVQDAFFAFEELVSPKASTGNRLSWTREFSGTSGKVAVRCFNTAWLSQRKDVSGQLHAVVADAEVADFDLVLTIFHHPYNWLQPENARAFKKIVETTSDVVLTGHEHDGDAYAKVSTAGATTNYVEGAALQASGVDNGFNFVKIDLGARVYQVYEFRWAKDMYSTKAPSSLPFTRNQNLLEHRFVNNQSFKKSLEDVGTPFSHPVKSELRLRDVFVYPDLQVVGFRSRPNNSSKIVYSQNVLNYIHERKMAVLAGPPTSGKTSLAKALYEDLQQKKDLVPLLLNANDFKGADGAHVLAAVARAFDRQYSSSLAERYGQLEPGSKVVIVDDWHRLRFNPTGRGRIVATLQKLFGRVILISDDASVLRQVNEAEALTGLSGFEYFEIKQFGSCLRLELITRWHSLGQELEVDEAELAHAIDSGEKLLDTLIAKGIVPAFPIYVLSALQANDHAIGQNVTYGSYGHIYEALLTSRLGRVNKRNLGQKYMYLSIMAYRLLLSGRQSLTPDDLKEVDSYYWKNYLMPMNQAAFLNEMVESQILTRSGSDYGFQYKFAYYFFVAKYFREAIENSREDQAIVSRLLLMADTAYEEENARILIFYLYLSKDRRLIEHILKNASTLFAVHGPSDLNKDVAFVNKLYDKHPTLVEPSEDTRKNRADARRQRDDANECSSAPVERDADALQSDLALESLQIMGQVLRNFPGDLRVDLKLRLTQESYQLGLRTLHAFLHDIETNLGKFREYLVDRLKENRSFLRKDAEEARHAADKLIIGLSEMVIFSVIKRVSFSVGLEDLRDVYKTVRSLAGEEHIPTRLIDLSIALDHYNDIPVDDIKDLEHRLRDNIVAHTVLRIFVAEHLALFPVKFKVRQSMVQLFNFQPRALLSQERIVKRLASGE